MGKNNELVKIKIRIVYSLNNGKYYNKRHTPIDNICKRLAQIPAKKLKKQSKN